MKKFNIRVYGILEQNGSYLLTNEQINDFKFVKFPGGGLEHGEGTIECLKREFREELGIDIDIKKHLYTTDFYQESAFNPDDQIISIYYLVSTRQQIKLKKQLLSEENPYRILDFLWITKSELKKDIFTFPIDKIVCDMLT